MLISCVCDHHKHNIFVRMWSPMSCALIILLHEKSFVKKHHFVKFDVWSYRYYYIVYTLQSFKMYMFCVSDSYLVMFFFVAVPVPAAGPRPGPIPGAASAPAPSPSQGTSLIPVSGLSLVISGALVLLFSRIWNPRSLYI